ncbi:MAG: four helix bundle protein [Bacteroidales bacterium]|nr:four helix bundle protein [Bacteroidales bacterium]
MKAFEDLRIWQDAQEIALEIYEMFKDNKDYGFRDQIQRAAISISNNIAEGSEYSSDAMMIRYLRTSKGSCGEVKNMLYLCPKLGYCSNERAIELIGKCKSLTNAIGAFIAYLANGKK